MIPVNVLFPKILYGQIESSEFCFRLFLFQVFDFDLIPKIENSEEKNSEKKFRAFRAFLGLLVFDLLLFRIFNQVSQISVSFQLSIECVSLVLLFFFLTLFEFDIARYWVLII